MFDAPGSEQAEDHSVQRILGPAVGSDGTLASPGVPQGGGDPTGGGQPQAAATAPLFSHFSDGGAGSSVQRWSEAAAPLQMAADPGGWNFDSAWSSAGVQRSGEGGARRSANIQAAAARGIQGPGGPLPFADQIQRSFGRHDISNIQAHVGGSAAEATRQMGASAYATGSHVAFDGTPDLHTAAHEAAHIVQQRAGVQLKEGVGQCGDAYEQHADAVADRVVQGQSAEALLDSFAGGASAAAAQTTVQGDKGLVQMDDKKPSGGAVPDARGGEGDESKEFNPQALEDLLQAVGAQYKYICLKQRDAVEDLSKDAKEEDPPPLWQSILVGMAQLALSAALGGVGGFIVKGVGDALKSKGVRDMVAEVVANAMGDAAKEFGKMAFDQQIKTLSATTRDSRELFFRSQRDALTDTAAQQEVEFIRSGKSKIRAAKQPMKQANSLFQAIQHSFATAYEIQRKETLDAWCSYQARSSLGTIKDDKGQEQGTDLGRQLGDTSAVGVIGMEVRCKRWGTAPEIVRAEIEGLNEGLRGILESRPLGSIKVPMTVKGYVGEDRAWYESMPWIQVGRNESGVVWVDPRYDLTWLYLRANPQPELWGPGGRPRSKTAEGAAAGARMLLEQDMKNLTLKGKLSG